MLPTVLIGPAPMREIPQSYAPVLKPHFELKFPKRAAQMTVPELLEQLPGCIASLAGSEPYTREVIESAAPAGLKVIARAGVGFDGVDLQAASDCGVVVTYAPGTNHDAVGEHALLLMLALAKNLTMQHNRMKDGAWPRIAQLPLRGRLLGIVGLGRTGKAVALRAKAFGTPIIATDPYVDGVWAAEQGIPLVPLDELLSTADIISLHVPKTAETHNLICTKTIERMKTTVHLINTSRGEVVHEKELAEALRSKRIAAAALDVFVDEPPVNNPLIGLENVLLTAHTAGVDQQSRLDMANKAAVGISQLLVENDWPEEIIVNPEVRAKWMAKR